MKRLGKFLWFTCVFFVISLAVALSVARLVLPEMSQYKGDLETLAQEQFSYDIRIGSLGATWKGFSPVLTLNDVTIPAGSISDESLNIRKVHVSIDLLNTLRASAWRTHKIELIGFHLSVYRTASGQWSLTRIPPESENSNALKLFLKQRYIGFEDARITWIDEQKSGLKRNINNVKFTLANKRNHRRFSFEADLPASLGEHILVIGDMTGNLDLLAWDGPLYFKGTQIDVQQISEVIFNKTTDYQVRLDAEVWVNRSRGKFNQISGDLQANNLSLNNNNSYNYSLDKLSSRFIWWSSKRGWRLNVDKISGERSGNKVFDNAAISGELIHTENRLNAAMTKLSISEMRHLALQASNFPDSLRQTLNHLNPQGQLSDIQIETMALPTGEHPVHIAADFEAVSTDSWGKIPGVSGLNGKIDGNLKRGVIHLESDQAILSSEKMFKAPVHFTMPENEIRWEKYTDRLSVTSSDFSLMTNAFTLSTRYQIDWLQGEKSPWIDMQLTSEGMKANQVSDYMPVGLMKPKLAQWFNRAFKKGRLNNINIVLQGMSDQFPYDGNEGLFQADFNISDGFLNYSKKWGSLEDFNGAAVFSGRSMQIEVDNGRILHSPISDVKISINDFRSLILDIKGDVGGRLPAMLAYVTRSPLDNRFGAAIRAIETDGSADLGLSLSIPLKKSVKTIVKVKGVLEFHNNKVAKRDGDFSLSELRGRIAFTEDNYIANNVLAKFRDKPVTVDVINASEEKEAQIQINGPLKLLDHIRSFNWPLVDHFQGETIWKLTLHIPTAGHTKAKNIWVDLQSDLNGIVSSLPLPFAKSRNEKLPIRIKWVPEHLTEPVEIKYGNKVDTIFRLDRNGQLISGDVQLLGTHPAKLPVGNEFHISGHLPVAAPLQWISLFTNKNKNARTERLIPLVFNLSTDRMALTKYFVRSLKITSKADNPWNFKLSGVGASGTLQLDFDNNQVSKIISNLNYLSLRSSDLVSSTVWGLEKITPDSIPDLNISVGDLLWDGREIGALTLRSRHENGEFIADQFSIESDALKLQAKGVWSGSSTSQTTHVTAEILDGELEKLLETFGSSDAIRGGRLSGQFNGGWPGSPAEFTFSGLNGELKLRSKDGRIVDADPGAGKLLGLLSLKSLPRRLFLDFSDLAKEGFSFDKIEGSFFFSDGNAFTNNLEISGPVADISIAGRTGMVSQDYDELVTVIPSITSTLPIAGAIAGGPVVGAVVLLAERVIGEKVNKMSKIEYQVTGSWDDPKYEKLTVPGRESMQEDNLYVDEDGYDE